MEKWNRLQTLAHEKDERLKENRKKWKHFKRQLSIRKKDLLSIVSLFLPYTVELRYLDTDDSLVRM